MIDDLKEEKKYFLYIIDNKIDETVEVMSYSYIKEKVYFPKKPLIDLWTQIYCYQRFLCPDKDYGADEAIEDYFAAKGKWYCRKKTETYRSIVKKMLKKVKKNDLLFDKYKNESEVFGLLFDYAVHIVRECIDKKLNDPEDDPCYSAVYPFNVIICMQRLKHGGKWKSGIDIVKDYFDEYVVSDNEKGSEKYYDIVKKQYDTEKEYYEGPVFV